MTPTDKAAELVDKMYFSRRYSEGEDYIPEQAFKHAIKCALIAVDEIISMQEQVNIKFDFNIKYWQEVKQEIELL